MGDDKPKKDSKNKHLVGVEEDTEVQQVAEQMAVSKKEVLDAIASVGSDRKKIVEFLTKNNKNRHG